VAHALPEGKFAEDVSLLHALPRLDRPNLATADSGDSVENASGGGRAYDIRRPEKSSILPW
jgi:hypothetical protein